MQGKAGAFCAVTLPILLACGEAATLDRRGYTKAPLEEPGFIISPEETTEMSELGEPRLHVSETWASFILPVQAAGAAGATQQPGAAAPAAGAPETGARQPGAAGATAAPQPGTAAPQNAAPAPGAAAPPPDTAGT